MFKSLLPSSSSSSLPTLRSSYGPRFQTSLLPSHLYLTRSAHFSAFSACDSPHFTFNSSVFSSTWATSWRINFSSRSEVLGGGESGGSRNGRNAVVRRSMSGAAGGQIDELIETKNALNSVVVYSKTWCPYCGAVKNLFDELKVKFLVVELDELVEERDVQESLHKLTGQSTVPSVFIGGKHIGGCDDTMALHRQGKLLPLLVEAGAKFSTV